MFIFIFYSTIDLTSILIDPLGVGSLRRIPEEVACFGRISISALITVHDKPYPSPPLAMLAPEYCTMPSIAFTGLLSPDNAACR